MHSTPRYENAGGRAGTIAGIDIFCLAGNRIIKTWTSSTCLDSFSRSALPDRLPAATASYIELSPPTRDDPCQPSGVDNARRPLRASRRASVNLLWTGGRRQAMRLRRSLTTRLELQ